MATYSNGWDCLHELFPLATAEINERLWSISLLQSLMGEQRSDLLEALGAVTRWLQLPDSHLPLSDMTQAVVLIELLDEVTARLSDLEREVLSDELLCRLHRWQELYNA